jgi:hypothetical protein
MLEKEVAHLQVALQERRAESEQIAKKHGALEDENKNLRNVLIGIQNQQVTLHEMLARYHENLQATRSIRNQLVQTLMRQDDGDSNTQAIIDMAHKIQRQVASSLVEVRMHPGTDEPPTPAKSHRGESRVERDRNAMLSGTGEPPTPARSHRGESRIERDRNALRNEHAQLSRVEQARRRDGMHEATNRETYETVKALGDEISAMTECSD